MTRVTEVTKRAYLPSYLYGRQRTDDRWTVDSRVARAARVRPTERGEKGQRIGDLTCYRLPTCGRAGMVAPYEHAGKRNAGTA